MTLNSEIAILVEAFIANLTLVQFVLRVNSAQPHIFSFFLNLFNKINTT